MSGSDSDGGPSGPDSDGPGGSSDSESESGGEDLEFAQDLAELSEGDLEDLAGMCSADDDSCIEAALKGPKKGPKPELAQQDKPKKKGPPKSKGDMEDLPSDLDDLDSEDLPDLDSEDLPDFDDLPSCGSDDECAEMVMEAMELGEGKKPKGPKPDGVEGEMVKAVKQYDADGSGKISKAEGKQLLKDVGFTDDVADMITEGLGEELDEEPTPEEIVQGVKDLAEFIAKKEGVAPEEVADAADEVDPAQVTKEDVAEFVAYLEKEDKQ